MTRDEELLLATRIQAGDETARNELAMANLDLAGAWAGRYSRSGQHRPDMEQEGFTALLEAAGTWDGESDFREHASPKVASAVRKAMSRRFIVGGYGRRGERLAQAWNRATAELQGLMGRSPFASEVATRLKIGRRTMVVAMAAVESRRPIQQATCTEILEAMAGRTPPDQDHDPVAAVRIAMDAALNDEEKAAIEREHGINGPIVRGSSPAVLRAAETKLRDFLAG